LDGTGCLASKWIRDFQSAHFAAAQIATCPIPSKNGLTERLGKRFSCPSSNFVKKSGPVKETRSITGWTRITIGKGLVHLTFPATKPKGHKGF
jgi:hypothetical protein